MPFEIASDARSFTLFLPDAAHTSAALEVELAVDQIELAHLQERVVNLKPEDATMRFTEAGNPQYRKLETEVRRLEVEIGVADIALGTLRIDEQSIQGSIDLPANRFGRPIAKLINGLIVRHNLRPREDPQLPPNYGTLPMGEVRKAIWWGRLARLTGWHLTDEP